MGNSLIWSHEATAFTPWPAKHLDILGDELGTHLAVVATEAPVGEFRLDIQALDEQGRTVIIENQFEPSDHAYLGQLGVYASGVDASSVIWVATPDAGRPPQRSGVAQRQHTARRRLFRHRDRSGPDR